MATLKFTTIDLADAGDNGELVITNDITFSDLVFDTLTNDTAAPEVLGTPDTLNIANNAYDFRLFQDTTAASTLQMNLSSDSYVFRFAKQQFNNGTKLKDFSIQFTDKDTVVKSSIDFYHDASSGTVSKTYISINTTSNFSAYESLLCAGDVININAEVGLNYTTGVGTTDLSKLLQNTTTFNVGVHTGSFPAYAQGPIEFPQIVEENYEFLNIFRDIFYVLGSTWEGFPSGTSPAAGACHLVQGNNNYNSGIRWTGVSSNTAQNVNWNMSVSGTAGTPTGTQATLNFHYSQNSDNVSDFALEAYISDDVAAPAALNFTGQHRNSLKNEQIDINELKAGTIYISCGEYCDLDDNNNIFIDDSLPLLEISSKRNDKRVFGVLSNKEDVGDNREYSVGCFTSVYKKTNQKNKMIINSLGEGAIWVCNINGNLENGDYITTCEVPGLGMKQEEERQANYTVAKITCDCDFDLQSAIYKCEEFEWQGQTYRKAFVGCTYHCG